MEEKKKTNFLGEKIVFLKKNEKQNFWKNFKKKVFFRFFYAKCGQQYIFFENPAHHFLRTISGYLSCRKSETSKERIPRNAKKLVKNCDFGHFLARLAKIG